MLIDTHCHLVHGKLYPQRVEALAAGGLTERLITTGEHCWGCTAGAGSSCGGALA